MVRNAQFCDLTGAIRREDGEPDFFYAVFDYVTEGIDEPYEDRYENLVDKVKSLNDPRIVLVPHVKVNNLNELKEYERICLDHRFEGVMVRSVDGPYKCGRSSVKEGYLLKIKRVVDSEAEIIDLLPMMHNDNEPDVDMFGRTKRSHCQDGMVEMDTLGKFVVKDDKNFPGATFEIGTGQGLTQELRKKIWMNRNEFKGRFVKYKYQDCGTKDLPRFPVWLGFRDGRDK
jgi:DNA ligase-1